jgi:aerobic carbon-monoxide dehydrogenase medium subunit
MKPVTFAHAFPASKADAMVSLGQGGASLVAGNQSLGPMLNLRLARPEILVDLSSLEALRAVEETETHVRYGARVTHGEIEDGEVPDPTGGWLREAAAHIAYRAVRNRGTIGGSLCHADPAADWAIVMTTLDATAIIEGPTGERRIQVEEFITGPYMTALAPGEILTAVEIRKPGPGARWGYWKYVRQVGDFAKASAAVYLDPGRGVTRCVVGALGRQPLVLANPESLMDGSIKPADAIAAGMPDRLASSMTMHVVALTRAIAQAASQEVSS